MVVNNKTPKKSVEETDCEKYDHIPEAYDIAFWHCKVCKKELVFTTLEKLQAERQRCEEMVEVERNKCFRILYDLYAEEERAQQMIENIILALTYPNNTKNHD